MVIPLARCTYPQTDAPPTWWCTRAWSEWAKPHTHTHPHHRPIPPPAHPPQKHGHRRAHGRPPTPVPCQAQASVPLCTVPPVTARHLSTPQYPSAHPSVPQWGLIAPACVQHVVVHERLHDLPCPSVRRSRPVTPCPAIHLPQRCTPTIARPSMPSVMRCGGWSEANPSCQNLLLYNDFRSWVFFGGPSGGLFFPWPHCTPRHTGAQKGARQPQHTGQYYGSCSGPTH
mmetsp:Transcript_62775/g.111942  ORF Transcript_62775/g.111942 Transcript_62775/m.111942 type:complete len:228 (-) Transcript_62775:2033-2716(-)